MRENPQNYLVPHPDDCHKFYSCQNLGRNRGYWAHLMDCPPTTAFDTNLRICNFIRAVPRCGNGNEADAESNLRRGKSRILKAYEDIRHARQTVAKKNFADVNSKVSYLKANEANSASVSALGIVVALALATAL